MDLVEAAARQFDTSNRHPWEAARFAIVRQLIDAHVRLAPGDVVLDVGCGDTYVAEQLAHAFPGVRVLAIDTAFTADLIGRWRERLNARNVSLYASLEDVPPPGRSVALVLLMDVIEHVPDDAALLREVAGQPFVTAATRFLITVPSYQRLFCAHDRVLGHYRRYTQRLLRARTSAAGLAVVASGYFFLSLLPLRVAQVVGERLRRSAPPAATGLTTWSGGRIAGAWLARLLVVDAKISLTLGKLGVSVPGLSTFAVCRKSA